MSMHRFSSFTLLGPLLLAARARGRAPLKVVATTEDVAASPREVGGDRVAVDAIARGYQDPHFVEPKPSFILMLNRAELLAVVGRELEIGWLPPLVTAEPQREDPARRRRDTSTCRRARASSTSPPGRSPAPWATSIPRATPTTGWTPATAAAWPRPSSTSSPRCAPPTRRTSRRATPTSTAGWRSRRSAGTRTMAPYKGAKVVTYHRSWSNLVDRFGLDVIGFVEPRPGIPPSPAHTFALMQEMKRAGVKVLLVEPYFDLKTPNSIARETGAKVVVLPPSVGGVPAAKDYIALFDHRSGC